MAQYIVFPGLTYAGKKDENLINKEFKKNNWGRVKFVLKFKTQAGQSGEGGRTDVVFSWFSKGDQVGRFSIQRFEYGIKWLGDYISNNSDIIPTKVLIKLKKMRDRTGDYGAGSG